MIVIDVKLDICFILNDDVRHLFFVTKKKLTGDLNWVSALINGKFRSVQTTIIPAQFYLELIFIKGFNMLLHTNIVMALNSWK